MTSIATIAAPGWGLQTAAVDFAVTNRSGDRAVGDLVMLDVGSSDAATTTFAEGAEAGAFANVILPAEAATGSANAFALQWGIFGVVVRELEGGGLLDNTKMIVRFRGTVQANVSGAAQTLAGEPLIAVGAQDHLDADAVAAEKVLGITLEATVDGTEELVWVLFDGISGFGNIVSIA
jgi:hypothetical protein